MAARKRGGAWIKWTLGVLVAIVVLLIVAVVALPSLIPADAIRDRVVTAVHEATGRDLAIKGEMSVSTFPSIVVSARDVSFSNAPWAAKTPMMTLGRLDVQLRVIPLLSGRVEIASFVLDKPVIDLETDKQGRGNWQFGPGTPAAAAEKGKPAPAAPAPAQSGAQGGGGQAGGGVGVTEIALGDVHISDGELHYTDGVTGKSWVVNAVNLKVSLPDLDSPLAVDGSLNYRDKPVRITLNAAKPRAMMAIAGSQVGLKIASDPLKLDFAGTLALAGAPRGAGDIDLAVPSVRDLMAWATGQPATLPGSGFGPFALKGKIQLDGSRIAMNGIQIGLDGMKGSGDLAVDSGGPRPSIKGQLAVDHLDVNPYLPSEQKPGTAAAEKESAPANGSASGAAAPGGWSDEPIDTSPLQSADIDLGLAADSIAYRKVEIGKTGLKIALANGKLAADLANMALYQGNVQGRVELDGGGATLALKTDLKIDKVQVEPLLQALAQSNELSGAAIAEVSLTSHGRSQRDLVSALNGNGKVELQNGVLRGIDLEGIAKTAAKSLTGGSSGGRTDFKKASGSFVITNGILHNNDLVLETTLLTASGRGTVDLPKRTVDYHVEPKLASAVPFPIIVEGPWDNISWRPDIGQIVPKDLGNPAKALNAIPKGAASGVTGALNKLLGK